MNRKTWFKVFTIIGIPASFFVLFEFFLRGSTIAPPINLNVNEITIKKPHSTYYNKKENFNLVKINNFGFHDFDREKFNNNYRIAFIGDSFVEGLQVPRDSLFTEILNRKYLKDQKIESIPFGISGTGTAYQYKMWKNLLINEIEIDHIILVMFLGNDLKNNHIKLGNSPVDNNFYLDKEGNIYKNHFNRGVVRKTIKNLRNHSSTINLIYQRLYLLKRIIKNKSEKNTEGLSKNLELYDEKYYYESISGTLKLILKWRTELEEKGINFSLITFNVDQNNQWQKKFLDKIISDEKFKNIKHKNIEFLESRAKYLFKTSIFGHFNARGQKFFSSEISKFLDENYKLNLSHK